MDLESDSQTCSRVEVGSNHLGSKELGVENLIQGKDGARKLQMMNMKHLIHLQAICVGV